MSWDLEIENIAGIRRGSATLAPGLNTVRASNWQGKSSFLKAIETVVAERSPLTEGTDAGHVSLSTDEDTYAVELKRDGGHVTSAGSPYLRDDVDRVCAELFAFLGEENEIRRAVRTGENLEPLLTRPLDFENIDSQIATLREERDRVDGDLSAANDAAEQLPSVLSRINELSAEVDDLEAKQADAADSETQHELHEELSDARAEKRRLESQLDRLESTAERVTEQLESKQAELDSLDVPAADALERELNDAQDALRQQERDIELLQSVYEVNHRIVSEGRFELLSEVSHTLLDDEHHCWVCGAETTRSTVEDGLSSLADRLEDRRAEAMTLRERVEEIESRTQERERQRRKKRTLETEVRELRQREADATRRLEEARERRESLAETIDSLAAKAESETQHATDVKSELKYARARLDDKRAEAETLEAKVDQREDLRAQRENLTEQIATLRRRKREIKQQTRTAFSDAIQDIVPLFETGFESARLTSEFDLVVARNGREASLDALSEGEVELLGLVTALAGHEAFDVADRVPLLLVDRLGGIADDNLGRLTEYLSERAEFLVTTAYPEHTSVDGHEIDPSGWTVVSDIAVDEAN